MQTIHFDGVFSSPLQRAYVTAQIATGQDVIIDERLIEADFGLWEKKTRAEFIAENEQLWIDWANDPSTARAGGTGETAMEIVLRVNDFFVSLQNSKQSGNFLVAAHNGVNRFYLAYQLGMPLRNYRRILQLNSSVTMFSLEENGDFVLQHLNSSF